MKKNLLTIGLLSLGFASHAQTVYVGDAASLSVKDQALVYGGGGWQNAGTGAVDSMGDIMVVGGSSDKFDVASTGNFLLDYDTAATRGVGAGTYGQLYISGLTQANITGNVNKVYQADFLHASDGSWQNMALPFYNYTLQNLNDNLIYAINMTNGTSTTAGRWNPGTVFKWNNDAVRFDHLYSSSPSTAVLGKPTDYFLVPRKASGASTVSWNPNSTSKTFIGRPAADDANTTVGLSNGGSAISFGVNGNSKNYYTEKYNTYIIDPFVPAGFSDATFGKNLYQYGNPFLTNIDLSHILDSDGDGIALSGVTGITVLANGNVSWTPTAGAGSATTSAYKVITPSGTSFQAGDVNYTVIKPMEVFYIKMNSASGSTLNLNNTRHFSQTPRVSTTYDVNIAKNSSTRNSVRKNIPADVLVKQVAVVAKNASGQELGRAYYAVSQNSITGANSANFLQATTDASPIFTSEELVTGGADTNQTYKLYINAANENNFAGKPVALNLTSSNIASFSFEVYEGGERVANNLSNGKSFYIAKDGVLTQITDNSSLSANGTSYNLYYEQPTVTLATAEAVKSQTVIAKKDQDWVVRFAKDWKDATVEVYSGSGQLINISKNVNTSSDFIIPMSIPNGFYLVKAINTNGETVIKKIIK